MRPQLETYTRYSGVDEKKSFAGLRVVFLGNFVGKDYSFFNFIKGGGAYKKVWETLF